jgi:hypothetical protein
VRPTGLHASWVRPRAPQNGCTARGLRCVSYVERRQVKGSHLPSGGKSGCGFHSMISLVFVARDQTAVRCKVRQTCVCREWARLVPTRLLPPGLTTTPAFRKAGTSPRLRCTNLTSRWALVSYIQVRICRHRLGDQSTPPLRQLMKFCTPIIPRLQSSLSQASLSVEMAMARFVDTSLNVCSPSQITSS